MASENKNVLRVDDGEKMDTGQEKQWSLSEQVAWSEVFHSSCYCHHCLLQTSILGQFSTVIEDLSFVMKDQIHLLEAEFLGHIIITQVPF